MFWVDQDNGWRYLYSPQHDQRFVVNQEEEVTRLLLGLGPRRPFRDRKEFKAAQIEVQALVAQIETRRRTLDDLRKDPDASPTGLGRLESDRQRIATKLQAMQSAADAVQVGAQTFQPALDEVRARRTEQLRRKAYMEEQRRQLDEAAAETSGDTELLSQNVIAQRSFRQFCGNENCQLFAAAESSSYGRRLLYLGDQMKDLQRYAAALEVDIAQAAEEEKRLAGRESELVAYRASALEKAGLAAYVSAIGSSMAELASLDAKIAKAREFQSAQRQFEALLQRLETARNRAEDLRPGGRTETAGVDNARSVYQGLIQRWLAILNAKNLPSPYVDEEFRLHFGADVFHESSPHSGSTRTRIVLAMHAALLETSLYVQGFHPPILLLDAPRQQELEERDLVAFIDALRELRVTYHSELQLVLAVKELNLRLLQDDVEWQPRFEMEGELKYLGPYGAKVQ